MICRWACITGRHVLVVIVMSFMRMCYGSTCVRWACLAGLCRSNHLSCCEFRHLVCLFFLSTVNFVALRHVFQEFII